MKNSEETKSDSDTEMSYADAITRQQVVSSKEPVEPKEGLQEAPGSVLQEGAGE